MRPRGLIAKLMRQHLEQSRLAHPAFPALSSKKASARERCSEIGILIKDFLRNPHSTKTETLKAISTLFMIPFGLFRDPEATPHGQILF